VNQYHGILSQYDRVKYATFFDLNENSMMDILLVQGGGAGQSSMIKAIYNNYGKDDFYLKTRVISDPSLGISVPSASFKAVLTSLEDDKFMVTAGQSGQTSYQSL
jgi:alpha-D-ribose 1-methylphosphonate 5-triphosphate synthase subunit PhnL